MWIQNKLIILSLMGLTLFNGCGDRAEKVGPPEPVVVIVDNDGDLVFSDTDPDDNDPCIPNPNAGVCDQDKDGLTNNEEVITKTDPKNPDTDGDILRDGEEVNNIDDSASPLIPTAISDPLDPCDPYIDAGVCDRDKDLLLNQEEDINRNNIVDSGETDPANADTDGDGLDDGEEVTAKDHSTTVLVPSRTSDPLDPCDPNLDAGVCDQDVDGLTNDQEATLTTDPKNPDTDGDGVKDGTDKNTTASTALLSCLPFQQPLYRDYNNTNAMWQVENCDGDDYSNGAEDNISLAPKKTWISDPYNANSACFVTSTVLANPCKSDEVIVSCEVVAKDGRTWTDRNLGACEVCTSSTDINCYGDFYQWGRGIDGHQERTSIRTQDLNPLIFPYSSRSHELASAGQFDWLTSDGSENTSGFTTQRQVTWQSVTNNSVCPVGWYVPSQVEFTELINSEGITEAVSAFGSSLKLGLSGSRSAGSENIEQENIKGFLWSTDVNTTKNTSYAFTYDLNTNVLSSYAYRATGYPIRCIKKL